MGDGKIDYSSFFDDEMDDAELLKLAEETRSKNGAKGVSARTAAEAKAAAARLEDAMSFDFDAPTINKTTTNTSQLPPIDTKENTEVDGGLDKVYDADTEEAAARELSKQYGTTEGAHGRRPMNVSEDHLEKLAEQEAASDSLDQIYDPSYSLNNPIKDGHVKHTDPRTISHSADDDIVLEEEDEQDTGSSVADGLEDSNDRNPRQHAYTIDSTAVNANRKTSELAKIVKTDAGDDKTATASMPSIRDYDDEQAEDVDLGSARRRHDVAMKDDDKHAALAPDMETMSKLESKALSELEDTADSLNKRLPMPGVDDVNNDEEKPEEPKYVIHADSNYLLVGDDDIGSKPFDIDAILTDAIDRGASDVHIAAYRPIKLRINGSMYKFAKYQQMDKNDMNDLMTGGGGLINKELLQKFNTQRSVDSAYVIRTGRRHGERFRVHFAEEMNAPAIVFRHIRPQIFTPEEIGLTEDVVNWGLLSQGMILVTGPTGSGKSATLSSILRHVQLTKPGKIITLEEPIETVYPLDGLADIWQREVPENCPSFVRGITDAMREDPDVILVGEIRDYATIQAAMQACNTGHLTFATIHANSAPDVVTRILDLAGDADKSELMSNLARNLKGILSQRLLLKPGNDGRVAVREVIQVERRQKRQIATGDVDGMAADLRAKAEDLDSKMLMMAIQQKTTLKSARSASMDRQGFDAMVAALSPRARGLIIDDVKHETAADSDPDLVKLH